MATSLHPLKHALTTNNYDFIVVQQYLKEALHILKKIPAFKRAVSAAGAADRLSLSQPQHPHHQASPVCGAFHVVGGAIDMFSHGANRITTDHLSKSCVEIIRQWHNTAPQVRKC